MAGHHHEGRWATVFAKKSSFHLSWHSLQPQMNYTCFTSADCGGNHISLVKPAITAEFVAGRRVPPGCIYHYSN